MASHFTEAQLKEWSGWVQSSKQASTYVHLSGRDIDKAYLRLHGLEEDEDKKEGVLKPRKCPRCGEVNSATSKFCHKCGLALNIKTALELESKKRS